MVKLIKAKLATRKALKKTLEKEIPEINELIEKAEEDGRFGVVINADDYSTATQKLIQKAGYMVNKYDISWAHHVEEIVNDEKELMKVAEDAGVKILEVQ